MVTINELITKLKRVTSKWHYSKLETDTKINEVYNSIPYPSSTTPSADTVNGSVGNSYYYARANHTHPKSTLYAQLQHSHSSTDISDMDTVVATVTYTDNTTETVTFYVAPTQNNSS